MAKSYKVAVADRVVKSVKPRSRKEEWIPKVGDKFVPIVRGFGYVAYPELKVEYWVCTRVPLRKRCIKAGDFEFNFHNFIFHKYLDKPKKS